MISNQTIYYIKTSDNIFSDNSQITISCITRICAEKKHSNNDQYVLINNRASRSASCNSTNKVGDVCI